MCFVEHTTNRNNIFKHKSTGNNCSKSTLAYFRLMFDDAAANQRNTQTKSRLCGKVLLLSKQDRKPLITHYFVLKVFRWTYRSCWTGERQTQQHQQRDELISSLHVGHGEVAVIASEAHHRRGKDICQLQEVQGHQGGQDNRELDKNVWTHIVIPTT